MHMQNDKYEDNVWTTKRVNNLSHDLGRVFGFRPRAVVSYPGSYETTMTSVLVSIPIF